jgi:tetratricopeptide (TPR) repeat protein
MTGRHVFPVVLGALLLALGWQTLRTTDRLHAGRTLALVEARTQAAIARGRAPSTMFAEHLALLATAADLDPLEIGIPIAQGAQFLLLRRPDEAIAAYQSAAALEPRPEIDLNLGRAYWMKGAREEARAAFTRALRLNPRLKDEIPAGALD